MVLISVECILIVSAHASGSLAGLGSLRGIRLGFVGYIFLFQFAG